MGWQVNPGWRDARGRRSVGGSAAPRGAGSARTGVGVERWRDLRARRIGALLVLVAALGYAGASLVAKELLDGGLGVAGTLATRFGLAAVVLAALAAVRGAGRPSARTVLAGLALGALFYAPATGLYFSSLTRLDAGMASLLAYAYPLVVLIVAAALGMERLTPRRSAAGLAALGGLALVLLAGGAGAVDAAGAALAGSAAVCLAGFVLASALVARGEDPVGVAALVAAGCAGAVALAGAATGGLGAPGSGGAWALMALLVVAGTVVPLSAFVAGTRQVGPARASMLMTAEPLATALGGVLLFAEPLGPARALGGLLVVGALAMLAREGVPSAPRRYGRTTISSSGRRPVGIALGRPALPAGAGAGRPTDSAQRIRHGVASPASAAASSALAVGKRVAGQVP